MANRYGEAALMATRDNSALPPEARWMAAMDKLYPTSVAARKKNCPRGAFLGLCEAGLVKGIPAGTYTKSRDNKACAVHAAQLLLEGAQRWTISSLWEAVNDDASKPHSSQMDVVMALWKNGLLVSDTSETVE